tara:strand:+ start:928 stop:2538 length:1611 start_codon:yes stop_codon:yes gene_type:complete
MTVLGIHCGFSIHTHEPGAALIKNGKLVAVCEEERLLRVKNALGYLPTYSIKEVLKKGGVKFKKIKLVVSTGITVKGYKKILEKYFMDQFGHKPKILIVHHHLSHIASAFYASGYENSACLSLDAYGDGASGMIAQASRKKGIRILEYIDKQNSIGTFYSAATEFLGYQDGDEYKVMGLASYGRPIINFDKIIRFKNNFWKIDKSFFVEQQTPFVHRYSNKFVRKFKKYKRLSGEKIKQRHKDFAASVQKISDIAISHAFKKALKKSAFNRNLCFAGGLALNCTSIRKILYSNFKSNFFIPSNPSDRGLAVGCAYLGSMKLKKLPKSNSSPYLGKSFSNGQILKELKNNCINFTKPKNISKTTASLLSKGKIIGWFNGRSEIGARALGNRSILADPRKKNMKDILNKKIKYREDFRPFAPAAIEEHAEEYFETKGLKIPYMNCTVDTKLTKKNKIPSVVHTDGTSRLQTVSKKFNPEFYKLLKEFHKITGVPILINTSFNLKGQPIVDSPRDALMTFFGSGIDYLVLNSFLISKNN